MNACSAPASRTESLRRIAEFASGLGPASSARAATESLRSRMLALVFEGRAVDDAVLKVLHGLVRTDPAVGNEFLDHFIPDLTRMGTFSMAATSRVRRLNDSADLVCSVVADLWPQIPAVEFESRGQFVTLLSQRLRWKAADKARKFGTRSRREDLRVYGEIEDYDRQDGNLSISEQVSRQEELDRIMVQLMLLKPRAREIIVRRAKGESIHEIAKAMGLEYDAARKALARAQEKLRELLGPDPDPHRTDPDTPPPP